MGLPRSLVLDNTTGLVLALVDDDRRLGLRVWFDGASKDKGAISGKVTRESYYFQAGILILYFK